MPGIALWGLGEVGQATLQLLEHGTHPDVVRVVTGSSGAAPTAGWAPSTVGESLSDDAVSIVVDTGEANPQPDALASALRAGKHVVTGNRHLVSAHWEELTAAAADAGVHLRVEAAVAGGLPVMRTLQHALACSPLTRVEGILDGPANLLLGEVCGSGRSVEDSLADLAARGEMSPAVDDHVQGRAAQQSLRLLATMTLGAAVSESQVLAAPLTRIRPSDVEACARKGRVVRQVSSAHLDAHGQVVAATLPTAVSLSSPWADVVGASQAVSFSGPRVERIALWGPSDPTAKAAILAAEVADVCSGTAAPIPHSHAAAQGGNPVHMRRWYVRCHDAEATALEELAEMPLDCAPSCAVTPPLPPSAVARWLETPDCCVLAWD